MREPKGWCPSAYRPMPVEDGLLARIRPPLARLTKDQALGLCALADRCGNGLVEITNRANFQIRGLTSESHGELLAGLRRLSLLDPDEETEKRRSILVDPFWRQGDETHCLAHALVEGLHELPDLPAKFGFVIDLGSTPLLQNASGDIRVERSAKGLIVRADGADKGCPVTNETCLDAIIDMSHWFAKRWTDERRRMAQMVGHESLPPAWIDAAPIPQHTTVAPGLHDLGYLAQV
ncbi:MAG: cobalamin biosynthesis protein CobG, partial [Pseudomonadota bacterium]